MTARVVVVGASGFGRECLDVVEAMQTAGADVEILGVVDDSPSEINLERLADRGIPYLGGLDSWLTTDPASTMYVLGIGSPRIRRLLVERLDASGINPFTAVHPSAVIGTQPVIGAGSVICAGAVVSTNVRLGRHVHINPSVTVGHDSALQDFVSINPAAVISGEVDVRSGTLVGAAATVLQNLTVGEDALIGAGAVVTKDVPRGVTAVGIPARWTTT